MENVRAIAFTEDDVNILLDEYESKFSNEYCSIRYSNSVMVETYCNPEMNSQKDIVNQLDFTEFLEILHPSWNINYNNSIAIYDDFFCWRKDIAVLILKGINYRM